MNGHITVDQTVMVEILWHSRETRCQTEKTNVNLEYAEKLVLSAQQKEPIMDSKQDLKEEIARVAYEIYERMGISGREEENWLEAERIVLERLSVKEFSQPVKKSVPSKKKGASKKKKISGTKV